MGCPWTLVSDEPLFISVKIQDIKFDETGGKKNIQLNDLGNLVSPIGKTKYNKPLGTFIFLSDSSKQVLKRSLSEVDSLCFTYETNYRLNSSYK